jgi:hypothetical protein
MHLKISAWLPSVAANPLQRFQQLESLCWCWCSRRQEKKSWANKNQFGRPGTMLANENDGKKRQKPTLLIFENLPYACIVPLMVYLHSPTY